MPYLGTLIKKKESGSGYLDKIKKSPSQPQDYTGTLGDLSRLGGPSLAMKTSTQAIPDATTGSTAGFLRSTGQSIARGYGAVGQGIVSAATGGKAPIAFTPQGKFQQALFGTDKPFTLQDVGEEYPGVPKGAGFAPVIGGLGVALDLVGGGGLKGLKGLTTALKDAKTAEQAARLMKGAGFTDDIIKDYSTLFAKTTDAAQIEKGLLAAEKLQNTTVARGVTPPITIQRTGKQRTWTLKQAEESVAQFSDSFSQNGFKHEIVGGVMNTGRSSHDLDVLLTPSGKAPTVNSILNIVDSVRQKYPLAQFDDDIIAFQTPEGRTFEVFLGNVPETLYGSKKFEGELWKRINEDAPFFKGGIIERGIPTATPTRSSQAPVAPKAAEPLSGTPSREMQQPLESGAPPSMRPQSSPSPELNHVSPENASGFKQSAENGGAVAEDTGKYWRNVSKLGRWFNDTVEFIQNKDRLVKVLVEKKGMKVTDATNIYQKMTNYVGIVGFKVKQVQLRGERIVNDVVRIAHNSGREVADVRADINKYLHAVHAPERNLALGDGAAGMTTEQAVKELERINALPNAAEIKRAAEELRKINEEGLVLLNDAGVISDELFSTLTTKYKNHVPLNRILEGDDIQAALSVRGFDVKSTGIKKAKGSEKEVADIFSNIIHNYEQAVLRSEKNIVDQATVGFVRENKEALGDLMVIKKPRAIGKTFEGKILMEHTTDPQYLQFYEKGKPAWIYIKDPELAVALRGVGNDKLGKVMQITAAATRFYSGLMTRFNLEFGPPNKFRDLQEMMVYAAAQKDLGFGAATKMVVKDPLSIKSVAEFYFGADTPGARLYREMQELGGTTGGMGLSTRNQVELNVDKMFATAASHPRQMFADVLEYIDNYNAILEDSTRLSVYKQAIAQGASKERAAFLAKESTINFNRMGKGGPVVNALYMFSNASIQGSAKLLLSLRNPKVAATVFTTVGASVATVNQWNDHVDPQWRDKVTRWDRLNSLPIVLPGGGGADDSKGFVRSKDGIRYVVLPVSWGLKPIKVMADFGYDAASGVSVDATRVASDFFTSVLDAYNPVGGTDLASAVTPTFIGPFPTDLINEVYRNQSWSGSKIKPDYDQNAPADIQYFKTLGESASGKIFIESTKQLQEMTGIAISPADAKYVFENLIGGAGRFATKTGNSLFGIATGEPLPLDEYPFVSRFYRQRTEEETGQSAAGEVQQVNKLLQTQSRERFYIKDEAEKLYEQWSNLPKEEARANWNALNKERPEVAKKITEVANQEAKGLTYFERQITELGVENGERAKYLFGKFSELKTADEKRALWELYTEKKIISAEVAKQLKYLIANPQVIKNGTP